MGEKSKLPKRRTPSKPEVSAEPYGDARSETNIESAPQDITCSRLFGVKPKKLLQRLYHDGLITLQQAEEVFRARRPEESAQLTVVRLGLLSHDQMLHYIRLLAPASDGEASTPGIAQGTDSVSDSDVSAEQPRTAGEEHSNNPPERGQEVVVSPAIAAESDSGTSGRTSVPSDQEEHSSTAQDKPKKQKDALISLGEDLLREKVITAGQLEQSLAQQGRTGESLIRILVRSGCVQLSQLEPYVKIGDLRKFAVLELENDYYQSLLSIMLIHRRNFRLFLGISALTILGAVWLHDQIQVIAYLCALAALATIYHRIQRRYYDLQAFFRQTRTTILNALDSCTTVGELSMVRDRARAGFTTAVPVDCQVDSSTSGPRHSLGLLGMAVTLVFVACLLLGAIKTNAALGLPGLTQDAMQAQSISLKRLSFSRN